LLHEIAMHLANGDLTLDAPVIVELFEGCHAETLSSGEFPDDSPIDSATAGMVSVNLPDSSQPALNIMVACGLIID
jgi:hypothetical protein